MRIEDSIRDAAGRTRLSALLGARLAWGEVIGEFDGNVSVADLATVANVHVLPWIGEHVVLVRSAISGWELPGGTREPGESVDECLARELDGEIGGGPNDFRVVGVLRCVSRAPLPYRPHLSHPRFNILLGEVNLSSLEAAYVPDDREGHTERLVLSIEGALKLLAGEPDMAILAGVFREHLDGREVWAIPGSS